MICEVTTLGSLITCSFYMFSGGNIIFLSIFLMLIFAMIVFLSKTGMVAAIIVALPLAYALMLFAGGTFEVAFFLCVAIGVGGLIGYFFIKLLGR